MEPKVDSESILNSIKLKLGLTPDVITEFDTDVIDAINMAISILTQMGIGPDTGYAITSAEDKWTDYIEDDKRLTMIKSYVYLKTKLIFDPPQSSHVLSSFEEQAKELEWRLGIYHECPVSFPSS